VDFPEVIAQRKRYFAETETDRMIASDIREDDWLRKIPSGRKAIILMEGVSMYLQPSELKEVLKRWKDHFGEVRIFMDSYTVFAAKATKYKNPINQVGVTRVYGLEDPRELEAGTGITFAREHDMTPDWLIDQLPKKEQGFFRRMFAGKMAKKIYRLYEFR
jgi:O-methyltransferase involved in polyketide biosynthesis